jgi:predicted small secreted protein
MKTIASLLLLSLAFALSGCNTVKGMGRDIGQAGNAIQRAAQ